MLNKTKDVYCFEHESQIEKKIVLKKEVKMGTDCVTCRLVDFFPFRRPEEKGERSARDATPVTCVVCG